MLPTWNETGIALANHLWQSTVFAISVGLLTLLFRRNGAAVRYRLWLIASIKFLVPFSLFVALGSLLHWYPVHPAAASEVPALVQHFSQPFTPAPMVIAEPSIAKPATGSIASIGIAFASVWFGGAGVVLLVWFVRWAKLVLIVRKAVPLEFLNPSGESGIRILSSPVAMEPGVFGVIRPALLLPNNIDRKLSDAQLKAIIAHEMVHVRGRDNLASALHTVVEALFWFHPLVWWLGTRLIDERERACDEAVLQAGHHPVDYAEGILKVCRSSAMSPACLAAVSGSNLRKRIEVIMENRGTLRLNHGKKMLLIIAGAVVLVGPVFAGMMSAAESSIAGVRVMQLPPVERPTIAALPATPPSSTPQVAPAATVQSETRTNAVQAGASAIGGSFIGLNNSTNNFLAYSETASTSVQAETPSRPAQAATLPVLTSATIAGLPVLSQAPGTTLSQTQGQELPTVGNNVLDLLSVLPAFRFTPSQQLSPAQQDGQAANGQDKWLGDVSIIISDEERKTYQQLTSDEQRQKFIISFWLRRDPTPGTPANEFKEEYDRRVAYANKLFSTASGIPGSQTERGKMYILNGPPDEIVSHPSGGTYNRPADQGGGVTNTLPFETWRYRNINGKGANVIYEFVDKQMNGNYTLEYDPGANSK